MRVTCVADISVGYGTPQLIYLVRSLRDYLASPERPLVLEMDQGVRPPCHEQFPDLRIVRVYTRLYPYGRTQFGKIEYIRKVGDILNEQRPEVVVLSNSFCLPVLWRLRYRPRAVVYYVLEMPGAFGASAEEAAINVAARDRISLVLYPEHNRGKAHMNAYGYHRVPQAVLYNAAPLVEEPPVPAEARNGALLYQGTIQDELTGGEFYLDPRVQQIPIDLYGLLEGGNEDFKERIRAADRAVRYRGYVDNEALRGLRRNYNYTIVYWSPRAANTLYACPNKFFESIADGVPPITAPHPQTKKLVEQYRCGLVLEDWSLEAFVRGLRKAVSLMRTAQFEQMVANCQTAYRAELNWPAQFRKIEWQLGELGLRRQAARAHGVAAGAARETVSV